jgi:hypothetical protein
MLQPSNLTGDEIVGLTGGDFDGTAIRKAKLGDVECTIFESKLDDGRWRVTSDDKTYSTRALQAALDVLLGQPEFPRAANDNDPVDLWGKRLPPVLPAGLLPEAIAEFATIRADIMGVDAGGLAMASLAVCAAAIPDAVQIQPKEHDRGWTESARLWVAVVGNPSTRKTPLITAATAPLKRIDRDMYRAYTEAKAKYDALPKDERADPPKHHRLRLEDTTIEAAQEVLKDSPNGVLLIQDELSGWFGGMDKYSGGGRGAAKDRGFWLQSFNGGSYTVNRIGRGSSWVDNLSVSLVGGIQPDPMRKIAADTADDGLLQRLFPIVLRPARLGADAPMPDVEREYGQLVERLVQLRKPIKGGMQEVPVRFDSGGQEIWQDVVRRNHELQTSWELVNAKLAAHLGKYDGLFARLCLLWHCIESSGSKPATTVPADVADRVRAFLYDFLLPHAVAFYTSVLGLSDRQDAVQATAGWILAHRPETVTVRDVRRGDRIMRSLDKMEAEAVMDQLDAFGWVDPVLTMRRDSKEWQVRPKVYEIFADRAEEEADRRATIRAVIASNAQLQAA